MDQNFEKKIQDDVNITLKELNDGGIVKIENNDNIVVTKNNISNIITLDCFLEEPSKYVFDETLNIGMLLILYAEKNSVNNMKKIIKTKKINSLYYDSAISHIMSHSKNIDIELLKLLYDEISINLRELLLSHCLSTSDNKDIIDWIFNVIDDEPYLEIDMMFKKIDSINLIDNVLEKIKERKLFDMLKNDLFVIMSYDELNLNKFINLNKLLCDSDLKNINQDLILQVLMVIVIGNENKKIGNLLIDNYKFDTENIYHWFTYGLIRKKFEILDFLLEKMKINFMNSKCFDFLIFMIKDKTTIDILKYLLKIKHIFEHFDLKTQNNILLRNAIINKNYEIVEFLFINKIYENYDIKNNELLFETINYFATDEISNYIFTA
jgi:hypothetical protein